MQHPVQLIPNPQQVPHCHLRGLGDTRTRPEPLETHRTLSQIIHPGLKTVGNLSSLELLLLHAPNCI